ncbi:hypothetical protein [Sphingomonas sp. AX6]|uniref:hypothetical protein n=1 Tax=Sphingomonas sp. AX6 TaxID=2653171 RepID=UPI0012F3E5D6|nr:hypothetical protein [Sphingomonas sp. AX6]VXC99509.1 exported hypothetical protein [Sphingomonas sp. AX6]
MNEARPHRSRSCFGAVRALLCAGVAVALSGCASSGTLATASDIPPSYPAEAVGGVTRIELTIGHSGRAISCAVSQSSGSGVLDERACNLHLERHRQGESATPERYLRRAVDWARIGGTRAAIATPIDLDALIARIEGNGGACVAHDLGTACRPSADRRAVDIAAKPGDENFFRRLIARLGNPCGRPGRELGGWRNGPDIAVADQKTLFLSGANEPGLVPMVDSICPPLAGTGR